MSSLTLHERELQNCYWRDRAKGMDPEEVEHCLRLFYSDAGQTWVAQFLTQSDSAYSVYDAYALHVLLSWWLDGFLAFAHVPVGVGPAGDRFAEENNARLGRLLAGFSATFAPTGGFGYCDDGTFAWAEPLQLLQRSGDGTAALIVEPGSLPLEVGRTRASRTIVHIICDCGVARWPYSAEHIALCVVTDAGVRAFSSNDDLRKPRSKADLTAALDAIHATRGSTVTFATTSASSRSGAAGGGR
jgi:hypothetical protein